jgi:2-amino-4-hydroxy-6-hydroxymethyldihydropteridine diphosphokinase
MNQTVYLGLGTNLGNKKNNLKNALNTLFIHLGEPIKVSSTYHSEPWGFDSNDSFLNIVARYKTVLKAKELLSICMDIESKLGRKRKGTSGYESRIIDIDILLFGDLVIDEENLKIPHPLITERLFVLEPLSEICDQKIKNIYKNSLEKLKSKQ